MAGFSIDGTAILLQVSNRQIFYQIYFCHQQLQILSGGCFGDRVNIIFLGKGNMNCLKLPQCDCERCNKLQRESVGHAKTGLDELPVLRMHIA